MYSDSQIRETEDEGFVALKERENNLEKREEEILDLSCKSKFIQAQMPLGLIGFENHKDFIFELSTENPVVKMQSDLNKELIFYLINPFDVRKDYQISLEAFDYQTLKTDSLDNVLIYSILTLHKDFDKITYNLLGPILLNIKNKIAKQCINNGWETKYLLSTGNSNNISNKNKENTA